LSFSFPQTLSILPFKLLTFLFRLPPFSNLSLLSLSCFHQILFLLLTNIVSVLSHYPLFSLFMYF
jgi:hypothetical protein